MSTKTPARARRPRGSLDPDRTTAVFAKVDVDTKAALDAIADRSGVSMGVVLEQVAKHLELDDRGLPVWWPQNAQQEELPLKTA
ncbi:ribbon-helix-helix protein, CopG family [Cellulomonas sp. 179-A 4D5 NHS]|uniref:ribbon-helix-helix protein, CopG family n=1 Tax=Cellulomonas sp. 179-A 4D5 NHS TaxID=3142378 RepID=UPI0039A0249C